MAKRNGRRRFGWVRKLPSGRFQASYIDPDGIRRVAPTTYEREGDASDWLTVRESEVLRGEWRDPDKGKIPFQGYAESWIDERSGLRPRTIELYHWLLKKYLTPTFGQTHLIDIDTAGVRRWRHKLVSGGVSSTMAAKAYRLLRAILMTAAEDDGLITRNPCRIRRAGSESASERPVLTVGQVFRLAEEMPPRCRCMVLVATFASLRFGEVIALERRDVDLEQRTIRVRQAFTEIRGQGMVLGPVKSAAGVRTVSIPRTIIPDLRRHLLEHVDAAEGSLVFTGPTGKPIRRGNFNKLVKWPEAVARIGMSGLHFHDLRHTGNTLAAASGVSTRDLMARMGHDSMNAAIIYQHATRKADRTIASSLDAQVRASRARKTRGERRSQRKTDDGDDPEDGTAGVVVPAS